MIGRVELSFLYFFFGAIMLLCVLENCEYRVPNLNPESRILNT